MKKKQPRWSVNEPRYSKGRIAKALELRIKGIPLREIERRTGMDYSYVSRLTKNIAIEHLPSQLQSERSRKAAIILLQRQELELTERLGTVKQALARFRAYLEPEPTVPSVVPAPAEQHE